MGTVSRTLKRLPGPMRRAAYAAIPFRYRYSSNYRKALGILLKTEYWSLDKLKLLQRESLGNLIVHAYKRVPYYRRIFDERGLTPNDFWGTENLDRLPILTRQIIRDNWDDLQAQNHRGKTVAFSTSGSTGEPLKFIGDEYLYAIEKAFLTRAYRAHDTRFYEENIVWMRHYVPPSDDAPLSYYDPELKRFWLSAFHLSDENLDEYIEIIDETKATTLSTYPSAAYILAMLLERANKKFRFIKKVHAASEQLLPEWEPLIKQMIGPIYMHYGMVEKVSLFHQCTHSSQFYHEDLEYGVTEILPDGRVIGTSLWNFAMPFIRYHTGDKAQPTTISLQCACGSNLPMTVKQFEGRCDDILVTPDGRYIPAVNFYTLMYKTPGVGMFQIIQSSPGDVEVQIVATLTFTHRDTEALSEQMVSRLGKRVDVNIKFVKQIKRDERTGKIRCVLRLFPLTSTES